MPYSPRVKQLAYENDPDCWISYSGRPPSYKRRIDARRKASLEAAERFAAGHDKVMARRPRFITPVGRISFPQSIPRLLPKGKYPMFQPIMTPLAIQMLMHFHSVIGPFGPEDMRTSDSYTRFVKYLLFHKLIERPSNREREKHPGWAYRTTERGTVYVEALQQVRFPVLVEQPWKMSA